jgi:hypothetical protein
MSSPSIIAALLGKSQAHYEEERDMYYHDLAVEANEAEQDEEGA